MATTITNDERRELENIYDILTMIQCNASDINAEKDMPDDEKEVLMKRIEHWSDKAARTILAILHEHYNKSEHSLSDFELGK